MMNQKQSCLVGFELFSMEMLGEELFTVFGSLFLGFLFLYWGRIRSFTTRAQKKFASMKILDSSPFSPSPLEEFSKESMATPHNFSEQLLGLPDGIQADIMSFVKPQENLNLSLSSRLLQEDLWESPALWGHLLAEQPSTARPVEKTGDLLAAEGLRNQFRMKVFRIEDAEAAWRQQTGASSTSPSSHLLLEEAARVLTGLMPRDREENIRGCFSSTLGLLRSYDVKDEKAQQAAERLVKKVSLRADDLFTPHDLVEAETALSESKELHEMLMCDEFQLLGEDTEDSDFGGPPTPFGCEGDSPGNLLEASLPSASLVADGAMDLLVVKLREMILEQKQNRGRANPLKEMMKFEHEKYAAQCVY